MAKVIAINSTHSGVGKSNLVANIAVLLAQQGKRVAVIDANVEAPHMHLLFNLAAADMPHTFNDYLTSGVSITQCAYPLNDQFQISEPGALFYVRASDDPQAISRVLRADYNIDLFAQGVHTLGEQLTLDVLVIDTNSNLTLETLLVFALTDLLALVLRLDPRDYQGTGVSIEIARRLEVPHISLIVNEVPPVYDSTDIREQMERTYACPVAAILPYSDDLPALGSAQVFAYVHPDHPLTEQLRAMALVLLA